jgi:membrane-bound metal-dependent hydrolase YbcI (DUF457 family)
LDRSVHVSCSGAIVARFVALKVRIHHMPSPLAHLSLVFLYDAILRPSGSTRLTSRERTRLLAGLLVCAIAPDFDLLLGVCTGEGFGEYHNGFTHSLPLSIVFGAVFAAYGRRVSPLRFRTLFLLGASAYASHVLMDAFVWMGRGVQICWPISDWRWASPVPMFLGVRHSVNAPHWVHAATVGTELILAVGFFLIRRVAVKPSPPAIDV